MKLTFYGGAGMVTGSNYLLENEAGKILIDCGLFQGSSFCENFNFEKFPYKPEEIDAVFVTHAHIDHIGRLPKLYKNGFRGKIFSTEPTKNFSEISLIDSEGILSKEAAQKNHSPIYTTEDVNEMMRLWEGVKYHQKIHIKDFEIEFFDAGHILGSAFILIKDKNTEKKVVFSGDLGNVATPIVKDTEPLPETDYVLIESTYGNRLHEDLEIRKDILEDVIEETMKFGGTLMIPAFAMERTQDLLYEMNELVENGRVPIAPVFIDSPLAIKLTAVYKKYSQNPEYFDGEALALMRKGDSIFDFPNLRLSLTTEQSKKINEIRGPKVIIAGSGMSQGGRILHHEMRYLSDPKSAILFIGYQTQGSLGRQILDGAKSVKIFGEDVAVNCRVKSISGYSAHADRKKLMEWLRPQNGILKKVFVMQGEEDQAKPFADKVRDDMAVDTEVPLMNGSVML
ncbi:MAG: MBL fold metallo-hydrolase [Patescibacteria group bacterium]|nr:MBL fold metallo-hydrolase [Patescibacteria group bacterium]